MKKLLFMFVIAAALALSTGGVMAKGPAEKCTGIQGGDLLASNGDVLELGFDDFGYNYQAMQYIGYYGNYQRPAASVDSGSRLMMKWNDAWLSNKDCAGDGILDRHYGFDTYRGSGAWLTNHEQGNYAEDGEVCEYNYFVKIVAAPLDAYSEAGTWHAADDVEIGPSIWGQFAIIQENYKDSCGGSHYKSKLRAGLGNW